MTPDQYIKLSSYCLFGLFLITLVFSYIDNSLGQNALDQCKQQSQNGSSCESVYIPFKFLLYLFSASAFVSLLTGIFGYFGLSTKNPKLLIAYIVCSGIGFAIIFGILGLIFYNMSQSVLASYMTYLIIFLVFYIFCLIVNFGNLYYGISFYKEVSALLDKIPF